MKRIKFKKGDLAQLIIELSAIVSNLEDDKEYVIEIKENKPKRSKSQNNYLWELLGQLSQAMGIESERLYQDYIKSIGIFRDIEINKEAVVTLQVVWNAYGLGWFSEVVDNINEMTTLRLYYGSSSYNSKQMSVLIDKVIQDCQSVGIETMTPEQIARMKIS